MSGAFPKYSILAGETRYAAAGSQPEPPLASGAAPRASVRLLEARVRRYNSDIRTDSPMFRAAVLLLAAVEFGQNIDLLARRTGYERAFVAKCARRLIDNGVWVGGRTVSEWSPDDEASGAFWNDVAVAEGKLCRRVNPEGSIEWAPAGYWNKSYDFVGPARETELSTVYRDPGSQKPEEDEPVEVPAEPAAEQPLAAAEAEETGMESPEPSRPAAEEQKPPVPPTELFPGVVWLG